MIPLTNRSSAQKKTHPKKQSNSPPQRDQQNKPKQQNLQK